LIQSKDWINFDPVLGQEQIKILHQVSSICMHVSKIKHYGWLIYSWITNDFEIPKYQNPVWLSAAYYWILVYMHESAHEHILDFGTYTEYEHIYLIWVYVHAHSQIYTKIRYMVREHPRTTIHMHVKACIILFNYYYYY
jgi:hypothetical protein